MAEDHTREDEGDCERGERRSDRPPARGEKQRDKGRDCTQADTAQRQAGAGQPHGSDHLAERRAAARCRSGAAEPRDEQQCSERGQRRRERNRGKAVAPV